MPLRTYRDVVLADEPTAYWRLGESPGEPVAHDETNNLKHGTYAGGVLGVQGATASEDTALEMDGNDAVTLPVDVLGMTSAISAKSLECWFRTTTSINAFFGGRHSVNDQPVMDLTLGHDGADSFPGQVQFLVRDNLGGGLAHIHSGGNYADGQWHHTVATIDSSKNMKLYVDGSLKASGSHGMTGAVTIDVGLLGDESRHNPGPITSLVGTIDEAAVYDLSLPGTQVLAHFEAKDLVDFHPEMVVVKRTTPETPYPIVDRRSWIKRVG